MNKEEPRVPVMSRLDIRDLAAVGTYFETLGRRPRSRSDLVHLTVSSFAKVLADEDLVDYPDYAEATAILETMGFSFNEEQKRKITHGLEIHDRVKDSLTFTKPETQTVDDVAKELEALLRAQAGGE